VAQVVEHATLSSILLHRRRKGRNYLPTMQLRTEIIRIEIFVRNPFTIKQVVATELCNKSTPDNLNVMSSNAFVFAQMLTWDLTI
jgi:hypothetical protein